MQNISKITKVIVVADLLDIPPDQFTYDMTMKGLELTFGSNVKMKTIDKFMSVLKKQFGLEATVSNGKMIVETFNFDLIEYPVIMDFMKD